MIRIEVSNRQTIFDIDTSQLCEALAEVLKAEGVRKADISLAIVDDAQMHRLNRRFLEHDYPTDVLSFLLERTEESLEGEVIVSTETAMARCHEFGWSATEELMLYAIHGTLHLVGYNDKSPADRQQMRERERVHLAKAGRQLPARPAALPAIHGRTEGDDRK